MSRTVFVILLFTCLLAWAAPEAAAQVSSKAYAPEDLSGLAVPDRIRVIEKEYAEQSSGRRIPDDQLEFYLDQIQRSRWSFSRIKQDIATSLTGNPGGGGWNPGPAPPPSVEEVTCESRKDRYTECPTPFRGTAIVSRQISTMRCVEGVNFGSRPGMVWVRNGCRARFVEDDRYNPPQPGANEVTCESRDNRIRECRTNFRGEAVLARQLSQRECIEGRSWGSRRGAVWVDQGCRATFVEDRGVNAGGDYSVTCSSADGRYQTCAWNERAGRPRLLDQLSNHACIEDRTWGYDRREGLWVDRGCRGRFGAY
jgi:hypothetical protein